MPRDGHVIDVTRAESRALARARKRSFERAAWVFAAIATGVFGSLAIVAMVVVLALAQPGWLIGLTTLGATALPLLLAQYARTRSRTARRALDADLDLAMLTVARAIVDQSANGLVTADLGAALRVEDEEAERLLTRLAADDAVHARVSEEGVVVYEGRTPPGRVRVTVTTADSVPESREDQGDEAAELLDEDDGPAAAARR